MGNLFSQRISGEIQQYTEEGSIQCTDDLQWKIKFGKAKNPTLPADLNEWTSDNFLTLKHCLPHKYLKISNIPKNQSLRQYCHFERSKEILHTENNLYEFKLLVRGSRDALILKLFLKFVISHFILTIWQFFMFTWQLKDCKE
ncbi:hypothetical protein Glove_476g51 [Diversispora epigaea]|uniref:Uncharacterized protein n=1 Tax=Diversispora epigaea TaxID=1348612 RepID=A0A397GKV0_9GLOM|nr:hypothetical protein Glove_476g51 [Diversispora epigaea]